MTPDQCYNLSERARDLQRVQAEMTDEVLESLLTSALTALNILTATDK